MGLVEDVINPVVTERRRKERAALYLNDPVLWAREYLGLELWSKQREFIESIRDHRNTAVAAGHGVGKTYGAAIACAWWVDVHPHDETFIASTAPTKDQVDLLWDNIRRVHGLARKRFNEGLVDHPLPGEILGDNKWKLPDGSLLGQGRKPPDSASDVAFQGRHATFLLAIGDEAVGLNPGFLEALGNIATAPTNRQLLLANPTDPGSAMAKLWDEKITSWNRLHISIFDAPTVDQANDPDFDIANAPALSGWDYINEKREQWGEEDPRYIARVLGQWAFDAGNTVYTAEELARAKNTVVVPYPDQVAEHGWDIARKGSDSTTGYARYKGEVWTVDEETGKALERTGKEGWHIRRRDRWTKAPLVGDDPNNPSTANRIHNIAIGDGVYVVKVDASGIGIGVVDGLNQLNDRQSYQVIEVFGGAASSDKRAYRNMRAEQFFEMKTAMAHGLMDLDPDDEELFDDLSGIQFENMDGGVIKIESKDDIRRSGRNSPDAADALWYAFLDVDYLFVDPDAPKPGDRVTMNPADIYELVDADAYYGGGYGF